MSKKDEEYIIKIIVYIIGGIILLPIILIYLLFNGIMKFVKLKSKKTSYNIDFSVDEKKELEIIDNMDGIEFEKFMTTILLKNGFTNVTTTKASGDYGADILGEFNGIKYAFQCKRFESKVGSRPIGEVLRGMNYYGCEKGVVITNNYYTKQAGVESKVNNVELWDRDKIMQLYRNVKENKKIEEQKSTSKKNKKREILIAILLLSLIYILILIGIKIYLENI